MSTHLSLRTFMRDQRGSTALMFGLSIVPLVVAAGGGLDLAQMNRAKQSLQNAVDGAALYGARASLEDDTAADEAARDYLESRPDLAGADIDTDLTDGVLRVSASRQVPTSFLGVIGINSLEITSSSGATMAGGGMELALILDVSGSMGGWKVESLKTAAHSLISTVYGDKQTLSNVWVAMAPFSGRVNIVDYGASWMQSGSTTTSSTTAKKPPKGGGGGGTTTAAKLCTGLRSATNREIDAPPSAELFPAFSGDSKVCPGPKAIALTASRATIDQAITALYTGDGTSTHIGMVWGWRLLSPKWKGLWGDPNLPLSHEKSPGKVAVIMTDGENHPNQSGDPQSTAQADAQLLRECTAMKAEGYTIYAVTFMMGSTLTALYQACATTPQHAFDANSSAELLAAFDNIGGSLNAGLLRLIY